jgi:hypothetical protein
MPDSVTVIEDVTTAVILDSIDLVAGNWAGSLSIQLATISGELDWINSTALAFSATADALTITGNVDSLNTYFAGAPISYLHSSPHTNGQHADTISVSLDYGSGAINLGDIDVHITPVNDAPGVIDGALADVPEDTASTLGDTVENIFSSGFSDIDGTFAAIAITADATTDEGEWQYSTDDGSNWYPLEIRDESEATVFDVSHRLRSFQR